MYRMYQFAGFQTRNKKYGFAAVSKNSTFSALGNYFEVVSPDLMMVKRDWSGIFLRCLKQARVGPTQPAKKKLDDPFLSIIYSNTAERREKKAAIHRVIKKTYLILLVSRNGILD